MKRLLRRIWRTVYHTVSFVWFAIAIVVVFFWIRGYWIEDGFYSPTRVIKTPETTANKIFVIGIRRLSSARGQLVFQNLLYATTHERRKETAPESPFRTWAVMVSQRRDFQGWPILDSQSPFALDADASWAWLGFAYYRNDDPPELPPDDSVGLIGYSYPMTYSTVWVIPYWAITIAVSLWPAIWLLLLARSVRNLKRMARGHCGKCDYNLRGDPTAETCPECGMARAG